MRPAFYLYLAAHFGVQFLVGLTDQTFVATAGGPSAALSPNLIQATMALLSGLGAALHSDRNRALHLVTWLAALAARIGKSALTIG